jgi:hypothetical protein
MRVIGASNQPLREMAREATFGRTFLSSERADHRVAAASSAAVTWSLTYHFRRLRGQMGSIDDSETMNGLRSYSFPATYVSCRMRCAGQSLSSHRSIPRPPSARVATASNGDGYLSGNDSSELISDRQSG